MAPANKAGVIGAGSAALRKVMSNPLKRRKPEETGSGVSAHGGYGAGHGAGHGTGSTSFQMDRDSINAMIEGDIIPRLLLAHSGAPRPLFADYFREIAPAQATRFATLPLELEATGLIAEVDRFLADGVSLDAIYLDLLAPSARRLGELWESDECDFLDVTMGLWRLQEVMREIAARNPVVVRALAAPFSVLVANMPGDQHTFGAQMVEEIFARAGWRSTLLTRPERRELLDLVSHEAFDVVTLTISRDCPGSAISSVIKALRGVSVNPDLAVLIGGQAVNNNPALVAEVGADGTGVDARAALELAEQLVVAAPVRAHALR